MASASLASERVLHYRPLGSPSAAPIQPPRRLHAAPASDAGQEITIGGDGRCALFTVPCAHVFLMALATETARPYAGTMDQSAFEIVTFVEGAREQLARTLALRWATETTVAQSRTMIDDTWAMLERVNHLHRWRVV